LINDFRENIMLIPAQDRLFNPLLRAKREPDGSASVSEQEKKIAELLNLSEPKHLSYAVFFTAAIRHVVQRCCPLGYYPNGRRLGVAAATLT
jgi:hypothetical protein